MKYNFTKLTGAGNDFIVFDGISNKLPKLRKSEIQNLCNRHFGIGADGILLLEKSEKYDFNLLYFNSDGSSGMLCANGGRSSIYYFSEKYKKTRLITFECCGKEYSGKKIQQNEAKFNLPNVKVPSEECFDFDETRKFKIYRFDTGSPHLVLEFENLKKLKILDENDEYENFNFHQIAEKIRNHKFFGKGGINVNIIQKGENITKIRSFERGVEGETLACGTGIIATALFLNVINAQNSPIAIFSKSNKKFIVNFERNLSNFVNLSLIGHSQILFSGEIEIMEKL